MIKFDIIFQILQLSVTILAIIFLNLVSWKFYGFANFEESGAAGLFDQLLFWHLLHRDDAKTVHLALPVSEQQSNSGVAPRATLLLQMDANYYLCSGHNYLRRHCDCHSRHAVPQVWDFPAKIDLCAYFRGLGPLHLRNMPRLLSTQCFQQNAGRARRPDPIDKRGRSGY